MVEGQGVLFNLSWSHMVKKRRLCSEGEMIFKHDDVIEVEAAQLNIWWARMQWLWTEIDLPNETIRNIIYDTMTEMENV